MMDDPTTAMLSLGIDDPGVLGQAKTIVQNPQAALRDLLTHGAVDARLQERPHQSSKACRPPDAATEEEEEEAPPPHDVASPGSPSARDDALRHSDNEDDVSIDEESPPPPPHR